MLYTYRPPASTQAGTGGAADTCRSTPPTSFSMVPARQLRPGDCILSAGQQGSGQAGARVTDIQHVVLPGRVAPFTMHGTLVVDGVLASSYGTHGHAPHTLIHAALAPLRW